MGLNDLGIFLSSFFVLFTIHHSLQQVFSVLVLELILLVLVAERVAQLQRVLQHLVIGTLQVDLSLDEDLDEFELVVEALEFSYIAVFEVVCLEIQTRSA